jgi:hypothetical protein
MVMLLRSRADSIAIIVAMATMWMGKARVGGIETRSIRDVETEMSTMHMSGCVRERTRPANSDVYIITV